MQFYKADDCLSFPCTRFLFAIPYQMELLHDSWPGFENQSMKLALKLLSITLHKQLLWLCQRSCKQPFLLLHFDPNPWGTSRHAHRAPLSSAGISAQCSIWHHTEKVTLLALTWIHTRMLWLPVYLFLLSSLSSSSPTTYFPDKIPYFGPRSHPQKTNQEKLQLYVEMKA